MLSETISFVRYNLFLVGVVVAAICAIIVYSEYSGQSGGGSSQFFAALYLGYCAQNSVLSRTGRVQVTRGMIGFGSYIWKNFLIVLVVMAIVIGVPLAFGTSFSRGALILICGGLFAISYPSLLALVGTWPTAGIAGSTSGLADAFARGRHGFVPTSLRMFAGIILPTIVSLLLMGIAASMSYETGNVFQGGKMSLVALVFLIVSQSLGTFGICYASIVLARKFQISEGGSQGNRVLSTSEISEIFQ
ncbi:hypothetical protein RLEG12_32255 [Rhizobium leguminosarum bv. trifolii CB782]|nr:hypothetical protein RLEG12_32255 [Rhizobium leguminosarum bv. trifolii CB782]